MITSKNREAWKNVEQRGRLQPWYEPEIWMAEKDKRGVICKFSFMGASWGQIDPKILKAAFVNCQAEILANISNLMHVEMAIKEAELKDAYMQEIKEGFEEMGLELRITCSGPTDPREE